MDTGGRDGEIPRGGVGGGSVTGRGEDHEGPTDGDRQCLAGSINIRQGIDEGDGKTTDN